MCFTHGVKVCNVNNAQNFTARAPQIRDAEKFCRLVNSEFPVISSTKYAKFNNAKNEKRFADCIVELHAKDSEFVRKPLDKARNAHGFKEAIITLIEKVKQHKIANCADFSKLCAAICNINGVEVLQPELHLVNKNGDLTGKIVDHAVLMIKPKKLKFFEKMKNLRNVIIIDPWLGVADFAPNIEQKFKCEFSKFFKIPDDIDIALTPYTPQGIKFDEDTILVLKEKYPNLIIKKGKSLIGATHND